MPSRLKKRGDQSPYLISIAEKAELITKLYESRQKNTQETLEELKKIIDEINSAQKEQAEKGMSVGYFHHLLDVERKRFPRC